MFLFTAVLPGISNKVGVGGVVLGNLANNSAVPLAGDVDGCAAYENVPIRNGNVEFKSPPVNVVQSFIR